MKAEHRVIMNSMFLYIKMLLSLFVTFYSTRIILTNLGINDFGIYNLVAGTISLLGFVNGSMSNTVQRFLAYELGYGSLVRLKKFFSISLSSHIVVCFFMIFLLEFLGEVAFEHFFVIEPSRIVSAKIAFQLMIGVTVLSTISSPFDACVYAHEDIIIFAIIDFISSLLKLFAAFMLFYIQGDKLILYCSFIFMIQLMLTCFKYLFCRFKYEECRKIKLLEANKKLWKEVFPFLGWNMLESLSWLGKNQGIAVLMNSFYGTVVNAAYGIGGQINGQVMFFSSSLLNAIRPQIYKAGGTGEIDRMLLLSVTASKFAFFVLLLFINPLIFLLDKILLLWLGTVPDYTERICILLLLISLISYMSIGVNIAIQAYGDVRKYQITTSLIILITLPIGYILYSFSSNVYLFLYIMVLVEFISVISKYYVASKVFCRGRGYFIGKILIPCIVSFVVSVIFTYVFYFYLPIPKTIWGDISFVGLDICVVGGIIYWGGLSKKEREIIKRIIMSVKSKMKV